MVYSELYVKDKFQLPTPVGLIAVLLIALIFIRLFSTTPVPSKAIKKDLKRLEITNNLPTQVTIFWQTNSKEKGWAIYGEKENQLDSIAFDDRDLQETKGAYVNHYITLKNLREQTRYYFKLISDENSVLVDSNGAPFQFTTAQKDVNTKNLQLAYGKVVKQDGQPLEDAVVLLSIHKSYVLSTKTKSRGDWLIPINTDLFDTQGKKITPFVSDDTIMIQIISEEGKISTIKTNLANVRPLPQTVLIGKDYQFLNSGSEVLSATTSRAQQGKQSIEITYPRENAIIPGRNPLIKGFALPYKDVIVIIESNKTISNKIKSDKDGYWKLLLSENLTPGNHTMTMMTEDEHGKQVTLKRNFSIAKSGEQVLGEATGEPTLSPPIPTSTIVPTVTIATATPTQPVSGSTLHGFMLTGASFLIAGIGLLLAF